MSQRTFFKAPMLAVLTLAGLALAAPAWAQNGGVRGSVVDDQGKPVEGATVTFTFLGQVDRTITVTTDKHGEYLRVGLDNGDWKIVATKDKLTGMIASTHVGTVPGVIKVEAITVKPDTSNGMDAKDAEAYNKKQKELEGEFNDTNTAMDAGHYDEAIATLQKMLVDVPKCAACYAKMGDAYMKKNDLDNAADSYQKAIDNDTTGTADSTVGSYENLAAIYNQKKKFDKANEASKKAQDLMASKGGAMTAEQAYNQGVILWNQGKAADAQPFFEKATQLDPKMADAFYQLGMCLLNQGKLKEAVPPFQEYLKLAPNGKNADTVKNLLATIK